MSVSFLSFCFLIGDNERTILCLASFTLYSVLSIRSLLIHVVNGEEIVLRFTSFIINTYYA